MLDRPDFNWTDEAVEALKKHWLAGLSCSRIAGEMGGGLTRNAVIGKVTRLKLPKRGKVGHHTTRTQRTDARMQREPVKPHGNKGQPKANSIIARASVPNKPLPAAEAQATGAVGLLALNNYTCRWPVGEEIGARQMFCGCYADLLATGPYCPKHTAKAEVRR